MPASYRAICTRDLTPELNATRDTYLAIYQDPDHPKLIALDACRTIATFVRLRETGVVRVIGSSCRQRWCPICGRARAAHAAQGVREYVARSQSPRLLTVTLRHTDAPLQSQLTNLYRAWRQLRRSLWFRRRARGGVWFTQVKVSPGSGQWHPHIHAIIDADYIPQADLSRRWRTITHGSTIVDIRAVRDPDFAARYVARYVSRPAPLAELPPTLRVELVQALHGVRMADTWGNARPFGVLTPPRLHADEYTVLGHWDAVYNSRHRNPHAQAIWTAYLTQTPVTPGWHIDYLGMTIPDAVPGVDTPAPDPPPKLVQSTLALTFGAPPPIHGGR